MDLAPIFKYVVKMYKWYFSLHITFAGQKIEVWSIFLYAAIVLVFIWFVKVLGR